MPPVSGMCDVASMAMEPPYSHLTTSTCHVLWLPVRVYLWPTASTSVASPFVSWLPCPWPFCCNFYVLLCTRVGNAPPANRPPSTLGHLTLPCHLDKFSRSLNWAAFLPRNPRNPQFNLAKKKCTFLWDSVWSEVTDRQKAFSLIRSY